MQLALKNCNMRSYAIGAEVLSGDQDRTYLYVIATAITTITVNDAEGGTAFTIGIGENWSPVPPPTNPVTITGTGTVVVGRS